MPITLNLGTTTPNSKENRSTLTSQSTMEQIELDNQRVITLSDLLQAVPEAPIETEFKLQRTLSRISLSPAASSVRIRTEETNPDDIQKCQSQNLGEQPQKELLKSNKTPESARSTMTRETIRLLKQDRQDLYKDYDTQVDKLNLRPFKKEAFERKSFYPANVLKKIPLPNCDRKKAFIDFLNANGKEEANTAPKGDKVLIEGNTFHGRKWKHHMSKARLSNFGPHEPYPMVISTTQYGVLSQRTKPRIAERQELDKVKDNLEMDIASSQEKFMDNLLSFNDLHQEIYGERFTKYLDLINYEKANYNAVDGEKLEEAYELVDLIYKGKEKADKSSQKVKQIKRFRRGSNADNDDIDCKITKSPPPTKIHIRNRSMTSITWNEDNPKGNSSKLKMKRAVAAMSGVSALKKILNRSNAKKDDNEYGKLNNESKNSEANLINNRKISINQ